LIRIAAQQPTDGGQPIQLSGPTVNLPVVSPDGKQIACFYWDEQATPPRGVMVLPFAGGTATKRFNIISPGPEAFVLQRTPEGDALLYIDPHLANIWRQPISGGEPTPLTDSQGDQIFNFAYSPDGKSLATARGRITEDVVMIENSK
jgi:Tol biopolymer transport system component